MITAPKLNALNGYLRISASRIASEIKKADPPQQRLMRAIRTNPFDLSAAIEVAIGSELDPVLRNVFSSEVMPVSEVASVAENLMCAQQLFSWALNYSSRDISRIAAILQSSAHPSRIVPAIIDELDAATPKSPNTAPDIQQRIGSLFSNPNLSRRKREELAIFIQGEAKEKLIESLRGRLPERAAFLGVPVCAGNFGDISDMASHGFLTKESLAAIRPDTINLWEKLVDIRVINRFGGLTRPSSEIGRIQSFPVSISASIYELTSNPQMIDPKKAAKELLHINNVYLRRGLFSPLVIKAALGSEILDQLSEKDAVDILIGKGTGVLWNFMHYADMPEDEAMQLLKFE